MRQLHRPDLYSWSGFDQARNLDFNGVAWIRSGGNLLFDPMPMSSHDLAHLVSLGGASLILLSTSDHTRAAVDLARILGARIAGPRAEAQDFPIPCDLWLGEGDTPAAGLSVLELHGSKTPGELAFVLDGHTLVTGDLVRCHEAGRLRMLPDAKLVDRAAAVASVRRLAALPDLEAVLVGDGWPVFRDGGARLRELADSLG